MTAFVSLAPEELEQRLAGQRFAFDVETEARPEHTHVEGAALRWHQSRPLGVSFACRATGVRCYVPTASPDDSGKWVYDAGRHERVQDFLWRLVAHPDAWMIGHHVKFDTMALNLNPNDSRFRAQIHDTSLLIHLYDSRERKSLEHAEQRWLGTHRKADHIKEERAHNRKRKNVSVWPFENLASYCIDDSCITEELFYAMAPRIGKLGLLPLYQKELRYLKLLWSIERRGVRIDPEALEAQWSDLAIREAKLEKRLYAQCGREFNWQAPKQLSQALYGDLGIAKPKDPHPDHRHTMTKYYTESATSSKLLVEKVKHPVGGTVLALRETSKLRATLEGWRDLVDDEPALHTSFNQTNSSPDANSGGTRTGRLSSTSPNLQNLANVTRRSQASAAYGEGGLLRTGAYKIRNIVVARPGMTLVAIDYCLHPETLVETIEGSKPIGTIVPGEKVYSFDGEKIRWGTVTETRRTLPNKAYRLTFDNGEQVIASANHRWPVRDGKRFSYSEKRTDELVPGERMVPMRKGHTGGNYITLYSYSSFAYTKQHQLVAEATYGPCPDGHVVHHKDGNRLNNLPSNLEYKPKSVHSSEHSKERYWQQDHEYRKQKHREQAATRDYCGAANPHYGHHEPRPHLRVRVWSECALCGQPFEHLPSRKRKYCSIEHYNDARTGRLNHKLVAIEPVEACPMVDITVEPHHNFALSCGVFTHNSQQEARLLALLSGEERMLALLHGTSDIYMEMAEQIWGVRDAIHRRWAKDTTLALNYGMNEPSLAEYLGVAREHAHDIIGRYFKAFPRIPAYLREVAQTAKKHGTIRTWEGRLWRPENDAEVYKGANAEIQGGAAGLLSSAALRVAQYLAETDAGWIVLLIHDEATVELWDDCVDATIPHLCRIMELRDIFGVPWPVEAKVGKRFGSLEKWLN